MSPTLRPGRSPRLVPAVLAAGLAATLLASALLGAAPRPVSASSVAPTPSIPAPAVPGAGTAYLGAFVDPSGTSLSAADPKGGTTSVQAELSALPAFDDQEGHAPSILSTFQNWSEPVDVAGLDAVAATGAIPLVTWSCGDTDAGVAGGLDDQRVTAEARRLAATNVPVLLRWFPDPNRPSDPGTVSCLGAPGAPGYVAAYQHIRSVFAAAGATNVAFVWSVDTSGTADQDWASYYPGDSVVDWIAADGDAPSADSAPPDAFAKEFGSWYAAFSTAGKPLMVSSTGAPTGSQSAYFGQILSDVPSLYPQIKSLLYVDAPDPSTGAQYQLDAAGAVAFQQLASAAAFTPDRPEPSTTLSVSQSSVPAGSRLTLQASVAATDNGGTVSFLDNGKPIKGCAFVPIIPTARCQTPGLAAGAQSFVAMYGGDATFGPSSSAPAGASVYDSSASPGAAATAAGSRAATPGGSPPNASSAPDLSAHADQSPATSVPLVPAAGTAYLGSFVDPSGTGLGSASGASGIASLSSELAALPAVQQTLARPLSIVPIFLNWNDQITVTDLDQVVATGAIPMITWNCGAKDVNVAAGRYDPQIDLLAAKLTQFGLPVFLRWFPDADGSSSSSPCLAGGGAAGYVAAFQHIHDRLVADGASNVSFVWSVDATTTESPPSWSQFYPGAAYVDWIGADGDATSPTTASVADDFGSWYAAFSGEKPLMISQTAAIPALQGQFVGQLSSVPVQFPQVRAIVYFDAPDAASGNRYELEPQSAGLQAFAALSGLPVFQPDRTVTATSVSASADPVAENQTVTLSASLANGDLGGYFTFSDNGSDIPGCAAVPVDLAGSCSTSSLAMGTDQITVDYSGDAVSGSSTSPPLAVDVTSSAPSSAELPVIPGPGQSYLGAWVRPEIVNTGLSPHAAILQELQNLSSFNNGLARPLSIVHMYQSWANPVSTGELRDVLAGGAIPMVDWRCGDTDASILDGSDDALIMAEAEVLAALKAPVFLRWYYEPNFTTSANYAACIGSLGPAGYAAAFRHIHDLFAAAGATNVAFVFSMSSAANDQDLYGYYPGSSYVDWIAVDGYSRTSVPDAADFVDRFRPWYSEFAAFGKPMMISETGSLAGGQADYFQQIEDQISSGGTFPLIKAVLYFDAPGQGGRFTWPLDPSGWQKFQSLSASPIFQPSRRGSTVTASASPGSSTIGHNVVLDAQLSATDFGGSVSFYANGAPVAGCQSLSVAAGTSCHTKSLPEGDNSIAAVYSGDAEFAGSSGATASSVIPAAPGALAVGQGAEARSGSAAPTTAFAPFAGLPDVEGLSAFSFVRRGSGLFSFALTLSLPTHAGSPTAGGSNLDPIDLGRSIIDGIGDGGTWVPVGGVIIVLLVSYMASTWMQDRRRGRRQGESSPTRPHMEAHLPASSPGSPT